MLRKVPPKISVLLRSKKTFELEDDFSLVKVEHSSTRFRSDVWIIGSRKFVMRFFTLKLSVNTKEADRYQRRAKILLFVAQKRRMHCFNKENLAHFFFELLSFSRCWQKENYADEKKNKQTSLLCINLTWNNSRLSKKICQELWTKTLKKIISPLLISSSTWNRLRHKRCSATFSKIGLEEEDESW